MAVIKSGATSDNLTVDATSKAARTTLYNSSGTEQVLKTAKASYVAATTAKTAVAAGTTVFGSLFGSATTIVRVHRIIVCATVATAAVYGDVVVFKRTAVGSGGTATTVTPVALDSNSAATTVTNSKIFTAAPTAGTGGGVIGAQTAFMPITGTPATIVQPMIFNFGDFDERTGIVLRGVGEGIELNFGTTTTNAPTVTFSIEYTESAT